MANMVLKGMEKIILEEREVEESNWNNKNIGKTKWTGKL